MIDGVVITPLKIINAVGGDVYHAMKCTDSVFSRFGEAYFSVVEAGAVKAWKRHRRMTMNLIVPIGAARFVMYDDRVRSSTSGAYQEVILSRDNYCRLTVPPLVWLGFQGVGEAQAMIHNIADVPHDPSEVDKKAVDEIEYSWGF